MSLYATCISIGSYAEALTFGRKYHVLDTKDDADRPTIKIQGDNERVRWFPAICFDMTGSDAVRLQHVRLVEPIDNPDHSTITAELILSNGEQRWCWFATPSALVSSGEQLNDGTIRFHYGLAHVILVNTL